MIPTLPTLSVILCRYLSRAIVDQATVLRAQYGFKTPDSIHLAAAIVGQCDLFLTNDGRLSKCKEITVEVLSL
ncbi:MAG: PIN domain-containing protein [Chloroflexi bacterium]|nr:PIN domain-containing protein [Chloroflexota bacterium]